MTTTGPTWRQAADFEPDQLDRIADPCDHCPEYRPNGEIVYPWAVRFDGDDLCAVYRCPKCRHTWFTSWNRPGVEVRVPASPVERIGDLAERVLQDLGWRPYVRRGGAA